MKKKLFKLGAAFALLTLLFAACKSGGSDGPDEITPPSVTGIVLHMSGEDGAYDYTSKQDVNPDGSYRLFWAVVQGSKGSDGADFNKTYTLTIAGDDYDDVVVSEAADDTKGAGGKKVTFKDDSTLKNKHITVTATAIGNTDATVTWEILVDGDVIVLTGPDFSNPQWVIKNTVSDRGRGIDSETTNAVTGVNGALDSAQKRYVIYNNEPGAAIDNQPELGGNCFRDVTIMYLDVPIHVDANNFKPFGIQARLRVTDHRTSAFPYGAQGAEQWGSSKQGLVMGFIEDPTAADFGQTFENTNADAKATSANAPFFFGFRKLVSGQHRMYARRPGAGYGSAGKATSALSTVDLDIPGTSVKYSAQLDSHDYNNGGFTLNTAKKEGFRDQEYVVKVTRDGSGTAFINVYDSTGTTELYNSPNNGETRPGTELTDISNYFMFLVYGVKAEISDIKIFYDGQQVWEDPAVASATPDTPKAKRVDITINGVSKVPGYDEDYSALADKFPSGGLPVTADVVPWSLSNRNVDWAVTGSGPLVFDEGSMWKNGSTFGANTLTATAQSGGVFSSVTFNTVDPSTIKLPTSLEITSTLEELLFGHNDTDKVTFGITTVPADAMADVTWTVTAGADAVTFDTATGTVKAKKVGTDTPVTIKATSTWDTNVYNTIEIIVKKDDGTRKWLFGAGTLDPWNGNDNNTNGNNTPLLLDGGLTLNPNSITDLGRWAPTRAPGGTSELIGEYVGCLQPTKPDAGAENTAAWGAIQDYGYPIKVTVIWTHSGNSAPDPERYLYMKFGETVTVNTVGAGSNLADSSTITKSTFTVSGEGAVELGLKGGSQQRIWAVMVEPVGDVVIPSGPYYEWKVGEGPTGGAFTVTTTGKDVNGKTWTRGGADITVSATTGIAINAGARLLIGTLWDDSAAGKQSTATLYDTNAELDFTTAKTVTIMYSSYSGTANFQVYLNNSGGTDANCIHGSGTTGGRRYNAVPNTAGGSIVFDIVPSEINQSVDSQTALATSFLNLRCQTGCNIVITGIKIEDK